jgi:kumamolisin
MAKNGKQASQSSVKTPHRAPIVRSAGRQRPAAAITAEMHAVVEGSHRVPLAGAKALGPANPHAAIEVTLKLRRKTNLPELDDRPKQPMTRDELTATYGASKGDIGKVGEVFGKLGLRTVDSSEASRTVRLSGTVAEMERAFLVKLFNYAHPSGNYRGRVGNLHVPVEVQKIVEGVFGLDNRRVARRRRQSVRETPVRRNLSSVPASWYRSGELAAHYNYPPGDGAGQTVGLLEFGGGYFADDLQEYCKLASVGVPMVTAVSTDGTSTSVKDDDAAEVMLDVEVVAGVCPQSKIVVYFAEWTEQGWITALDAAIHDQQNDLGVLSISWGAPEDTNIWTAQAMRQINQTLLEAAHLRVTVCIAAGDDGSSDADLDGHAHVDFPAASPYVLAVGGTTIPKRNGTQPDIVWFEGDGLRQDRGGSTGGGISAVTRRPKWQANINVKSVNPGAIVGRAIPDLAANADWNASPYLMVVGGQAIANGGTSAASPLVASLIALINSKRAPNDRVGYLTPVLYQTPNGNGRAGQTVGALGCTDVVKGDNTTAKAGGYSAGPGYDAASGWGTPNGVKLLAALQASARAPAGKNSRSSQHKPAANGGNHSSVQFTATSLDVDDLILNYDPEVLQARFQASVFQAGALGLSDRLPHPVPWPRNAPTATPLKPAPSETKDLSQFAGYDAVVMTWTSAEAAALAALFTPNYLPSKWYEYRHNVAAYIPLVTGGMSPFNDKQADMARYYHSLGLYFPCTIGAAKVLLFKSGLHLAYDGPATPLKKLVVEIAETVKPKVLITTGTAGGIGKTTALGDVVIGPVVKFDCQTQFKDESWAHTSYSTSPLPAKALSAITPALLAVNAARLPNSPTPKMWHTNADAVVTTDFFGFDDSTDYYKLQGLGRVCEMGDAMVVQALQAYPKIKRYAIRNASDPQIPDPTGDITTAKQQAGEIYTKYGAFTTAGSAIATWAVIDALFN